MLAIHGDGGYLMNAQELETAVRHGINVGHARHEQQLLGLGEGLPAARSTAGATSAATSATRATTRSRGCSAPRATTSRRPTRSATPCRPRSACGKPAVVEIPIDPDEFPTPAAGGAPRARRPPAPEAILARAADQQAADERDSEERRDQRRSAGRPRPGTPGSPRPPRPPGSREREQSHRGDRQRVDRPPTKPVEHLRGPT